MRGTVHSQTVTALWSEECLKWVVLSVVSAQELELEDRQSQLQMDLRCRMSIDGIGHTLCNCSVVLCNCSTQQLHILYLPLLQLLYVCTAALCPLWPFADSRKSSSELAEEQQMLTEIMKVVERRDTLVSLLEEQRLQERAEDRDLESLVLSRGYQFHWT